MNKISTIISLTAIIFTLSPVETHSKAFTTGSYQKSCKSCTLSEGGLKCSCKTKKHKWVETSLSQKELKHCQDSKKKIRNSNGTLTCSPVQHKNKK